MPQVILQRTSEYNNSLRDYKMYIDGIMVGRISNGETKNFEIAAGSHTLIAKIDWASSPEIKFNIKEGESQIFKVGAYKGGNMLVVIATVIAFSGFMLKRTTYGKYLWVLGIPVLFILLYYISVGRKKFLRLSAD